MSERANRFTWERAIRDPKIGMPRELLCLALLLATYSTGKTGGEIRVSEATLRYVLGYDDERSVRRLVAELRDGYRVIRRVRYGNQYGPAEYALVLPGDLIERAEVVRDGRAADRARPSRQSKTRRAPDALRPEQMRRAPDAPRPERTGEHRTHKDRAPDAQRRSTGRSASPYQENQEDQGAPVARHTASERPGRSGAVVNGSVEGGPGAAPGPALDGRARLTEPGRRLVPAAGPEEGGRAITIQDQDLGDDERGGLRGKGQCPDCGGWFKIV
jgi:hypothetical protein